MSRPPQKKLIVILGPTASGKSDLAVRLAKKFNGEIISADSRQIYKGLDIGSGKVPKDSIFRRFNLPKIKEVEPPYIYKGVEHHLIDIASPKRHFTVVQYRKLALKAINKIFKNNKLPILCGGTGFYIQAVIDGIVIPEVPPNWKLRKELEKKPVEELYQLLKKLDPKRAKTIEKKNPRRLIRAIEITTKIGPVPILKKKPLPCPVLMLGIKKNPEELKKSIKKRFFKWLKPRTRAFGTVRGRQGFLEEVKKLRETGLSWKRIEEFGLHYRVVAQYLQGKTLRQVQGKLLRQVQGRLSYQEMIENSLKELQNYVKRQMTWFQRDKRIIWIKNYQEAEKLTRNFLN